MKPKCCKDTEHDESGDEFLARLDRENIEQGKERERENQYVQQLFDKWSTFVEDYLGALGKRFFGIGNYEIGHKIGVPYSTFWVEENIWRAGVKWEKESYDSSDSYKVDYEFKQGFRVRLMYERYKPDKLHLVVGESGSSYSRPFSEDTFKDYIATMCREGPREIRERDKQC